VGTAVLVIVLVGGGESGSDWAAGMLQALREALDRTVVVDVRERDDTSPRPEDAYVLSITFSKDKLQARLDTVAPAERGGKDVSFKKSDRALDRGRAIGYALAALLPELRADAIGPDVGPGAPTLSLHAFLPVSDYVPLPEPELVEERPVEVPVPVPVPIWMQPRASLEASAMAGSFGGGDFAVGPTLTAQVSFGKGFSGRIGGFALMGGSPWSGTELRRYAARLGFKLTLLAVGSFAFSVGGDAMALRVEVARLAETLGRWLPAVDGTLEAAFCFSRFALFVEPAFHWAFGPTTLSLQGVHVATVPEQLFALEIGLRWWP
jgi:hypothetical protein